MDLETRAAMSGCATVEEFKSMLRNEVAQHIRVEADREGVSEAEIRNRFEFARGAESLEDWLIRKYLEDCDVPLDEALNKLFGGR